MITHWERKGNWVPIQVLEEDYISGIKNMLFSGLKVQEKKKKIRMKMSFARCVLLFSKTEEK